MPATTPTRELRLTVPDRGDVGALLQQPDEARWLYVFAHGAGAPMRHAFMAGLCARLADRGVASLRYNFPYADSGKRSPDGKPVLLATVRAACELAASVAPGLPIVAGGKSMGGRMTSMAQAAEPLPGVSAMVYVCYPLHAPGKDVSDRADHLPAVTLPSLFVSGTRDSMCNLEWLRDKVIDAIPATTLHTIDDADHGFHVRKSSGRDDEGALDEIADAIVNWLDGLKQAPAAGGKKPAKAAAAKGGKKAKTKKKK